MSAKQMNPKTLRRKNKNKIIFFPGGKEANKGICYMNDKKIVIKTDASAWKDSKTGKVLRAGWAFVVYDMKGNELCYQQHKLYPNEEPEELTEIRCEMMAFIAALIWLKKNDQYQAVLKSDSRTMVNGILGIAKRKANYDLWDEMELEVRKAINQIEDICYIPREENSRADQLANQAANAIFLAA